MSAKLGGASTPPGAAIPVSIDNPLNAGLSAIESKRRADTEKQKTRLTKQQEAAVHVNMDLQRANALSARAAAAESLSRTHLNQKTFNKADVLSELWRMPNSAMDTTRQGTPWFQGFKPYIPETIMPEPSGPNPIFPKMKFEKGFKPARRGAPKGTR